MSCPVCCKVKQKVELKCSASYKGRLYEVGVRAVQSSHFSWRAVHELHSSSQTPAILLFQIENGKFIDFFRCRLPQEFALSYSYGLNRTRYLGTLVGPTVTRPIQDPLDVVNLDNRLYTLTLLENLPKYLLALHDFRPSFNSPLLNPLKIGSKWKMRAQIQRGSE